MHRIGHEPGQDDGEIAHHHGVFDPTNRFRHNVRSPMADQLERGVVRRRRGELVVRVRRRPRSGSRPTDCELDLVVEDLYPLTDFFPRGNTSLIDEFAAHHYESSGRVTGTARVGDRDARDRRLRPPRPQLGLRKWNDAIAAHRWVSAA